VNCERAIELILDSLVEPLAVEDREELDRHLAECESCQAQAATYESMQASLDGVAVPERSPHGLERLQAAVKAEFGDPEPVPVARPGWLRFAAAFALIALGAVLTVGLQDFIGEEAAEIVAEDTRMRFLFVMTETTEAPELSAQANEEIQAWFAGLVEQGILEVETAVGIGAAIGTPPNGPLLEGPVSGMVVIRAADAQEARRIAVTSPVIEYGGFIEIRSVE
jgi:hypothetical protein